LGACHNRGGHLTGGNGVLVAPDSVDVGSVYQGAHHQFTITISNSGDAALDLQLAIAGPASSISGDHIPSSSDQISLVSPNSLSLLAGDTKDLTLLLTATQIGPVSATLQITGDATANIALTAQVIADLVCTPPGPCLMSSFNPDTGQCVEQKLPDNQPCDDGDPCTTDKSCQNGLCKGLAATCEDNDVCTVDFCQPHVGCQHLDQSAHCNGNDPCQIYYCDPVSGCQSTPASDYTPCEASIPCQKANVCIGGHCTGVYLPDGIPCTSPIDPCATDGTCQHGSCFSPTANALKPGDVLWQVVSQAFAVDDAGGSSWDAGDAGLLDVAVCDDGGNCNFEVGFRSAATVDSDGNFFIDDSFPDGGIFLSSFDVCGNVLWRDYASRSSTQWTNGRHVLAQEVLFTVSENPQAIIGQSPVTGTHLWEFDPQELSGIDGGNFLINDVALGNNGILYYTADWRADSPNGRIYERMLGGVLRNGQSKFQVILPSVPDQSGYGFGYPLLVDENENLYTVMNTADYASAQIQSYDQTGALRFSIPVPRYWLNSFSENQGFFLEPVSLTAFDSQGKQVWSLNDPTMESNGHSPVVSSDDHLSILRHTLSQNSMSELDNFDPVGNLVWRFPVGPRQGIAESSVVLDTQGILYFLEGNQLFAVRESDGTQAFSTRLPTSAPAYQGVMSLTPAGSLLAPVSERLIAVFAGNSMSNAPWPRFRGDNGNRSSPPPLSGGVLP
jgi:outer membrane protein assembly factor BamB